MKYLKLNEAEIKRTFDEWLKNPKAPRETEEGKIYYFKFPAIEVTELNEGNINNYADLIEYADNYNVGNIARQIVTDLELDMDERDLLKSDELDDYFDQWIREVYGGQFYRFLEDYDFNTFDVPSPSTIEDMAKDFNNCQLEQYFDCPPEFDYDVKSVRMLDELDNKSFVTIVVETEQSLFEPEIEHLKSEITGQLSDGWGEGYTQRPEKERIDGLEFYKNILLWWGNSKSERKYGKWELILTSIKNKE